MLHPMSASRDPLHGVTLEAILTTLVDEVGFDVLGEALRLRCFTHEPSFPSSLRFLRRTPWARAKVESYYLFHLREQKRAAKLSSETP